MITHELFAFLDGFSSRENSVIRVSDLTVAAAHGQDSNPDAAAVLSQIANNLEYSQMLRLTDAGKAAE